MSRHKTKPEEIINPEHYFNRYIAKEILKDQIKTDEYYGIFDSLEELTTVNDKRLRHEADVDEQLAEISPFYWIDQIVNVELHRAVSNLSRREKLILTLRFHGCYSQAETAKRLGVSQQAISKFERRFIEKVKKILK